MSERKVLSSEQRIRVARESIPILKGIADETTSLAKQMLPQCDRYDSADGADVMARSFLIKQCEHWRSLRLLLDFNAHRDAVIIGRTMMEGATILKWAFAETPERTDRWFWFGAVLDWRQTLGNEAAGRPVDPNEKAELRKLVELHGSQFYTKAVRENAQSADPDGPPVELPDDPWVNKWTNTNLEAMAREVSTTGLYDSFYRGASEWNHWNIRAILRADTPEEKEDGCFSNGNWQVLSQAMAAGCSALLTSMEVLNERFSLGRVTNIEQLRSSLLESLNRLLANQIDTA